MKYIICGFFFAIIWIIALIGYALQGKYEIISFYVLGAIAMFHIAGFWALKSKEKKNEKI